MVWKVWLVTQSSAEPLGFCVRVLQQGFYYAKGSAEPSCRTPKVLQNSGGVGSPFEDWLFFLPLKNASGDSSSALVPGKTPLTVPVCNASLVARPFRHLKPQVCI